MINRLLNNIEKSLTPYHTIKRVQEILLENGFMYLSERDSWKLGKEGKYFCIRNDSSLIAFTMGDRLNYNIVATHTDSPCLKIKGNPDMSIGEIDKLNVEVYGSPILYSFLDRKLKIAGRILNECDNAIKTDIVETDYNVLIPSVAIHLNREVNSGYRFNPQIDLCPIVSRMGGGIKELINNSLAYDLFVVCDEKPYTFGKNNEFISSPRLDDLEGVFGSLEAFLDSKGENINVLALFDNEEVGSMTRQGANSTYLYDTLLRIQKTLDKSDEDIRHSFASSMMVSLDNAHAKHPNHPEFSDPTNETLLGGGIVIKNHANQNYTTDAYSKAYIKKLFNTHDIKYQEFYSKSDIRCGSTLGAVSSSQLSITSIDIGLAQFAMHSAVETASVTDYEQLIKGLKAFYDHFKI